MTKIAIIAALPGELKPLVRGWEPHGRNSWTGHLAGREALAVAGGIGAAAARRATEQALSGFNPDTLISYGWAGALTDAAKPCSAWPISEIIDGATGEFLTTNIAAAHYDAAGYRLITLDHVAGMEEKRTLSQKYLAALADMEAAAVARVAKERHIPFYCFKGVSDGDKDRLPDFNRFIANGELRTLSLLCHAALRPSYWSGLRRLGTQSSKAARALADVLSENLNIMEPHP